MNDGKSGVTAILPAFNNQSQLNRALASCYAQTVRPEQVIVIDDASEPPLYIPAELRELTLLIRQESNKGPYAARNRAIEMVKTPLVAFLDSDDVWLEKKIEHQIPSSMHDIEQFFSFTNGYVGKEGADKSEGLDYFSLSAPNHALPFLGLLHGRASLIANSSVMVSSELLKKHGPFDESKIGSDFKMWLKILIIEVNLKPKVLSFPCFKLNINNGSVSSNFLKKQTATISHLNDLLLIADNSTKQLIKSKSRRLLLSILMRCGYKEFINTKVNHKVTGTLFYWCADALIFISQSIQYFVQVKLRL